MLCYVFCDGKTEKNTVDQRNPYVNLSALTEGFGNANFSVTEATFGLVMT